MKTDMWRHVSGHVGYQKKPISEHGLEFDESNPCMKFGSNRVIND